MNVIIYNIYSQVVTSISVFTVLFRITTKFINVRFISPSINPTSDEERKEFNKMEILVEELCPLYMKALPSTYKRHFNLSAKEQQNLSQKLGLLLQGSHPRVIESYSCLLFSVEEASSANVQ